MRAMNLQFVRGILLDGRRKLPECLTALFVGGKGEALSMVLENAGIDEATNRKALKESRSGKHGGLGAAF